MSDAERPGDQPEPQHLPDFRDPRAAGPYPQPGPPPAPQGPQPNPYGPPPWQPYGPGPGPQPYGAPPQGQPGPYGPPRPPQPGPARPGGGGGRSKLPLVLVAAAAALLLVIGVAVAAVAGGDEPKAGSTTDPGRSSSSAPQATKPSDAVRGYLEALAANDAEKALSYLDEAPADTTFLSAPVLEASAKKAAISGIDVPEVVDEYAYRVAARYQLGDTPVAEDYSVTQQAGSWKLTRAVTELDLSYQRDETLPLAINGVPVTTDKVTLFPGSYAFSTDNQWLSYGPGAQYTWTGPSDYDSPRLTPTLQAAGKKAFVAATKAALDTCLGRHQLAPAGCPNRIALRPGQKVDTKSIRWSLTTDPFKNARVNLDSSDPTVAEASFYPRYRFRADGTVDGRRTRFDGEPTGIYSFRSTGDLSGDRVKVKLVSR